MAKENWPGMESQVMLQFAGQLQQDLALTVERFLAIQAMGSSTARQDIKLLKQAVLSLPLPCALALQGGLELLATLDLRQEFAALPQPVFSILGRLDSLVPVAIAPLLQKLRPGTPDRNTAKVFACAFYFASTGVYFPITAPFIRLNLH